MLHLEVRSACPAPRPRRQANANVCCLVGTRLVLLSIMNKTSIRFRAKLLRPAESDPESVRVVISHPDPAHDFQLIVTLAEAGENKTRLTWRQVFSSREHFDQVKSFVVEANEKFSIDSKQKRPESRSHRQYGENQFALENAK